MSLTKEQKLDLLAGARDHWLSADAAMKALDRHYAKSRKMSDVLKIGTIAAAVLTTFSGFVEVYLLTIIAGLITTGLAGYERSFAPEEKCAQFPGFQSELKKAKNELYSFAVHVDDVEGLSAGTERLTGIWNNIDEVLRKSTVSVKPADKDAADKAYNKPASLKNVIDRISASPEELARPVLAEHLSLADDADNVVELRRRVAVI